GIIAAAGPRHVAARRALRERGPRLDVEAGEIDLDAEIDPDLADGVAQIRQRAVGIAAGIADHDVAAAPPDHFVEPEILEMAAIGEVNIRTLVVGEAEQLPHDGRNADGRPFAAPGALVL